MEGIETLALFEEKISITPRDLSKQQIDIHKLLQTKLAEKIEGKCSLHGWVVPNSTKILSRSMGYLESGRFTGDLVFHIQAQASVLNPPSGSHLVCEVVGNNMMGMYVSYKVRMQSLDKKTKKMVISVVDAIKCILPRDLHIGDEAFAKTEIGDTVHVEIKKSRFQVNDSFILSVGVFAGKSDERYEPREVEESENVPEVEAGPSKVAAVGVSQFEEEEARKKEEEERKLEDEIPPLEPDLEVPGAGLAAASASAAVAEAPAKKSYRGATNETGLPYATGESILFNMGKIQEYKELDNRFPVKFTLDGTEWPSVEHYYQAMKYSEFPEYQEQIRVAPSANVAMRLGNAKDPSRPERADWKQQREEVVRKAVTAKFDQNPSLKELLLATYPRPLVFADSLDSFLGYGRNKQGQNKLGQILMSYRNTYKGLEALNG